VAEGGPGTIAGITAMGISYLAFAVAQPAIFRLMFGHKSARVAQGLDVRMMIADVTPKLLGVTPYKQAPPRGRKR
jgi:hypothetical protein